MCFMMNTPHSLMHYASVRLYTLATIFMIPGYFTRKQSMPTCTTGNASASWHDADLGLTILHPDFLGST